MSEYDGLMRLASFIEALLIVVCINIGSGGLLLSSLFVWFVSICTIYFVCAAKAQAEEVAMYKKREKAVPSEDVQKTVNLMED